jgi:hypothetical protein
MRRGEKRREEVRKSEDEARKELKKIGAPQQLLEASFLTFV